MAAQKHWTIEIYREGDLLEGTLFRVVDGERQALEDFAAYTVSDMLREAGQVVESELPEMFL